MSTSRTLPTRVATSREPICGIPYISQVIYNVRECIDMYRAKKVSVFIDSYVVRKEYRLTAHFWSAIAPAVDEEQENVSR